MPTSYFHHLHYAWLVISSFIAGIMNAMAGGGSFLSFPAMLALGVPAIQANATNTVALWPGQLTSLAALRSDLRRDLLPVVIIASILGGISGAIVLLHTRQRTFLNVLPWMLLTASLLFGISGPLSRWLRGRSASTATAAANAIDRAKAAATPTTPATLPLFLCLLPVCFYIGYFGAGAGFLIMTALALFGVEEMHALNSLKVLAACLANLSAVVTFIFSGAIIWHYCLVSMVFAGTGGYVGARYARRMNQNALRTIVVITGCTVAAYFFWRQR